MRIAFAFIFLIGIPDPATAADRPWFGAFRAPCRPADGVTPVIGICLSGEAALATRHTSKALPLDRSALTLASGYAGLLLGDYVSLHGRGSASHSRPYDEQEPPTTDRGTDEIFVQLGNPVRQSLSLAVGKGPVAFGMQHHVFSAALEDLLSERMYPDPAPQVRFAFDNRKNRHLDISFTNRTLFNQDNVTASNALRHREPLDDGISIRFFQDYPELYGTRLGGSFFATPRGKRQIGASLMNKTAKEETTILEYTRNRADVAFDEGPDEVGFRATYRGPWIQETRIVAQIEDLSAAYRMGAVGADFLVLPPVLLNLVVSYIKSEAETAPNRWVGIIGVGATL